MGEGIAGLNAKSSQLNGFSAGVLHYRTGIACDFPACTLFGIQKKISGHVMNKQFIG